MTPISSDDVLLHPLLPPRKGHSAFSLLGNAEKPEMCTELQLFLGVQPVDRFPNRPDHFLYKLAMARLRLVGFRYADIQRVCPFSENTLRKWARVLQSGSAAEISRTFGLASRSKITPDAEAYVRYRYKVLLGEGRPDYRQTIRRELDDAFGKSVSGERLRWIFREVDAEDARLREGGVGGAQEPGSDERGGAPASASTGSDEDSEVIPAGADASMSAGRRVDSAPAGTISGSIADCVKPQSSCALQGGKAGLSRNFSADSAAVPDRDGGAIPPVSAMPLSGARIPGAERFLHHLGLVLFLPFFGALKQRLGPGAQPVFQWIAQLLAGAVNAEQGKLLNTEALAFLIGEVKTSAQGLRNRLSQLYSRQFVTRLAAVNAALFLPEPDAKQPVAVYYDPHGKAYTGKLPFLKGWCGRLGKIAKVIYMDTIHSAAGCPLFVRHYDNFYDLRERVFFTRKEFRNVLRHAFGFTPPLVFVMDRGIYSIDGMKKFVDPHFDLITWDMDNSGWDWAKPTRTFIWRKPRNHSCDLREYRFECQEGVWKHDARFRRIVARVAAPDGTTGCVAILCSARDLTTERIVRLMCNRWIQENDFGYMIAHLGFDELDSRRAVPYAADTPVHDRMVESRAFKRLRKEREKLNRKLGALLCKKKKALAKFDQECKAFPQKQGERIASDIALLYERIASPNFASACRAIQRRLARARKTIAEFPERRRKLEKRYRLKIEAEQRALDDVEKQLSETVENESRLQALIEEHYLQPDTSRKAVMDMGRLLARNAFYQLMESFRPLYDNRRDDHDILRSLVTASGNIHTRHRTVLVELLPAPRYTRSARKAIDAFLAIQSAHLTDWFGRAGADTDRAVIVRVKS